MRYLLTSLLCVLTLSLSAQDINKMNKSKLKEHVVGLSTKIDALKDVNYRLEESKDSLLLNVSLLATTNDKNEIEISRLSHLVLINNQEIESLQSDYDIKIVALNKIILNYQDSILHLQDSIFNYQNSFVNNQVSIIELQESVLNYQDSILQFHKFLSNSRVTTNTSNDFLNKYYKKQIPLPNNSFRLVLSKLVFESEGYDASRGVNASKTEMEILDVSECKYWGIRKDLSDINIRDDFDIKSYVFPLKRNKLASKSPVIEVLKNKLFTIKYNDGSEESFLFNVSIDSSNNHRRILRIELANEEVDNNSESEDIVWNSCVIEDECYLALTKNQLNRINYMFLGKYNIQIFSTYYNKKMINSVNGRVKGQSTGEGIYLSRNTDYLDLDNVTFLFKLIEL